MLPFVPVAFDLYRRLKPRLRWAMPCLVSFADRTGRCWPSCRKFAVFAGISKSAAQRQLTELVAAGVVARKRRPGRGYEYQVARQFLPREPVSQLRKERVPLPAGQETKPEKQTEKALTRRRFAERKVSFSEIPDERAKWEARLRSWRKSRFWLPQFGPRPGEPGCFTPVELLQSS